MIGNFWRKASDCKDDDIAITPFFPEIGRSIDEPNGVAASHHSDNFLEVTMHQKNLIIPERQRRLAPPFAWVDRRFLLNGFLAALTPQENLLYFFLVLVADRDGLSFYNYDKICQLLKLEVDDYIQARNGLIDSQLIAFDGRLFQVLALPTTPIPHVPPLSRVRGREPEAQNLADVFARWSRDLGQND